MNKQLNSRIQPGFCIVKKPGTLSSQAYELFQGRSSDAMKLFMNLNDDTQWVKPGQILIIADPYNNNQTYQLDQLKQAKKRVNQALITSDVPTADFLDKNYGTIAALTNFMDKSIGAVSDAGDKYFSRVADVLNRIEKSYQNQFRTQGSLISQQFYSERAKLFSELDSYLNNLVKRSLKFRPYDDIKRALNLSSRAIVHDWQTAGVGAIQGYSTYIDRAANAAKYMKAGGWVAIGFSGLNATNEVIHSCTIGRENECKKVAVREYSKFGVSTAAGIYGGTLGAYGVTALCIAAGIPTGGAGTLACGIVGGIAAGAVSSSIAEKGTNYFMDLIL